MFILGGVRPLDITQGRICLHDTTGNQVVQLLVSARSIYLCDGKVGQTPRRYLSCPRRSRYLLQKGKVPKFLLMTLRIFLAEVRRREILGASARLA